MSNTKISPREPEEWLQYIRDTQQQIYPILEWHDEVMQGITETIEKIPILPDLLENVTEQINVFVFSLIAPFLLPIIGQIKSELGTGSNAIIESSAAAQHIVFKDDDCSDPTHSMLSKDHFSNVLNEPAGKIAGQVLKWVIPQIIHCWDDERADVDDALNRIIRGVFHHPALREQGSDASEGRQLMFSVVERWWSEKSGREQDSLRDQLSRDGVEEGRNHKEGVVDHGHGSARPLGMPSIGTASSSGAPGGPARFPSAAANQTTDHIGRVAGEAVGGGALGSIVGGLASAVGRGVLQSMPGNEEESSNQSEAYGRNQYSSNNNRTSGRNEEYSGYNQSSSGYSGRQEERRYEQSSDNRRYESNSSSYGREETSSYAGGRSEYASGGHASQQSRRRDDDNENRTSYGRQQDDDNYQNSGNRRRNDSNERQSNYGRQQEGRSEGGYGGNRQEYNSGQNYGESNRQEREQQSYGRNEREQTSYGRSEREQNSYGRNDGEEYDGGRQQASRYGREEQSGEGSYQSGGYGSQRRDNDEMPGGFGEAEDENRSSGYGRRNRDDDDSRRGYGY